MGLATTPGKLIRVPVSGYDVSAGMEVIVLFADEDSVALRYAREDSAGSPGYTVHLDRLCTDRDLPQLPAGQLVGTARDTELVVAIVDSGAFMDARSCNEWWQIRPGYGGNCPPA